MTGTLELLRQAIEEFVEPTRQLLRQKLVYPEHRRVDHPDVMVGSPENDDRELADFAGMYDWGDVYIQTDRPMESDIDVQIVVDILCHEHMHCLLHRLISVEACLDLDNIVNDSFNDMMHNRVDDHPKYYVEPYR